MKKIKIFLIVIAVLMLVLIIAVTIFLLTFDINRYKTQIVNQASAALGRSVDFGNAKLAFSLKQGVSLKIMDLRIAEDPVFGEDDFLLVKEASLGIDALGFIFNKKVDVSGILIDSPRIRLIREKDGSLNVNSLAKPEKKDQVAAKATTVSAPVTLPTLLISSLRMTGGTLVYIDRAFDSPLSLEINQISLEANKISLTAPFPIVCEAALLSNQKNVRLEAKVGLDLKKNAADISGLKGVVDLSKINLEKIPLYFPMAKGVSLPTGLKGQAQILFKDFTVSEKGLADFLAQASLEKGWLKFKELASPIEIVTLNAKITPNDLSLDKISASIGTGKLEGSGIITDYSSSQKYSLQASADNLLLQELIVQDKAALKLEGIASGGLKLNGHGFGPQDLETNLSGQAQVSVVKPRLRNINVLRTVLDKIAVIPGLSQKLAANLPERFKQKLTDKDTLLSDINLPATITNGRLMMKELVIKADEFRFEGWGEAGFDGSFTLEGAFLIPPDLSQAMVAAARQLEYLLSTGEQIYIPLRVSGNASKFEFTVDAAYIVERLLAEQGKKQLLKVLDKAFGREEEPAQGQQEAIPESEGTQEEESSSEEAVRGLLEEIFQ
jgi:hypothetical protein